MRLSDIVDHSLFTGKRIAVHEQAHCDATFIIDDLVCITGIPRIFSFYHARPFYAHIDAHVSTVFEDVPVPDSSAVIIDDHFTAETVFGMHVPADVCIYRYNSLARGVARQFGLVVDVAPLSGQSPLYDGHVRVMDRDRVFYHLMYKVRDGIGTVTQL